MNPTDRIAVSGADHHLGSAICAALGRRGFAHVQGDSEAGVDPADAAGVLRWFEAFRPALVFHAAGKCGGIGMNRRQPATLMTDNLAVNHAVLAAAHCTGVRKLVYLASSCCYPRDCDQPMRVSSLWTGPLEPTNEAYAAAKLAGITLCQAYRREYGADFVAAIPTNHFGPGDDFSPQNSHVVAALLLRMHEAARDRQESVVIWGTGAAQRELLFDDDVADAALTVMQHYSSEEPINLGGGQAVSIRELAMLVRDVVGYQGRIDFDATRPDGMPIKILESSALAALGWRPRWSLRDALAEMYRGLRERLAEAAGADAARSLAGASRP